MSNTSISNSQSNNGIFATVAHVLLSIAFLSSGYVLIEPAPFDLIILLSIVVFLFAGARFPSQINWVFFIGIIHLAGSFIGSLMSNNFSDSYFHIIITTYMVLFSFGLIIMVYNDPQKIINIIINAYIAAALISTFLAIMGYFNIASTSEAFTLYGRAKGGFKDPNVFGPFLVLPLLFLIDKIIHFRLKYKIIPIIMLGILLLGLLLSFSRGAWGLFFFSSLIFFLSMYYTSKTNHFRVVLSLYIFIALIFLTLALLVAINLPAVEVLFAERASLTQVYDVGDDGRFAKHFYALKIAIEQPWGIGAREFRFEYGEDVHNTYLTTFLIGGWMAGFSFIFIMLSTMVYGFKYCFTRHSLQKQFSFFYAVFLGLALEAWIIDIDHWRLLFIVLGVIWGIIFYQRKYSEYT